MKLKEKRELLFRILFSHPFDENQEVQKDMLESFTRNEKEISEEDKELVLAELAQIRNHLPEIDDIINQKVERWNTKTMAKVELAILRMTVYELFYKKEVPIPVLANDAVTLASAYGQDNSFRFVNGAVAKIVEGLDR
ncbi:MAG: transcription antitermination factor NusB [Eubacteriales bacterium]|nr:transcription antitermination factor NusB [Eubacteriales bacterium]